MSRVESMVRNGFAATPGRLVPALRALFEPREHMLILGAGRVRYSAQIGKDTRSGDVAVPGVAEVRSQTAEVLHAASASWQPPAHPSATVREGLTVLVSDQWLQWMVVPWNDQLLRANQAEAQYVLHCSAAFGNESQRLTHAPDDVPAGDPRLVAAVEPDLLAGLRALAQERGTQLVSVQPLSFALWRAAHATLGKDSYGFAVIDQGVMSLLLVHDGSAQQIAVQSWSGSWPMALEQLRRRTALREPGAVGLDRVFIVDISGAPSVVETLPASIVRLPGITAGAGWLRVLQSRSLARGPDFLGAAAPVRGWRLAVMTAGVLLAITAGLWHRSASQALDALEDEVAELSGITRSPAPPVPQARQAEMRAIDKAVLQLNVPVDALLAVVQAPADLRVALLGLDVSGDGSATNTVRVSAEARTSGEMAAYVSYLGSTRPFAAAVLTRHEVANVPGRPYRFTVEATWTD